MSLEKKERRRCDICGEVISDVDYYSCSRTKARTYDEYYTDQVTGWIGTNYPLYPTFIDVCLDCWAKMENSK